MDSVWERMNLPRCMNQLAFYHRQKRMLLFCLFIVWISSSCRDSSQDNPSPVPSIVSNPEAETEPTITTEYWIGGEFSGQSIYSLSLGISKTAHDIFTACGLGDEQIKTAVATHLDEPEIQYRGASRQGISEVDKDRETIWSVSIGVTTISEDLYLVTCFGKRP